ncbi:hypothetical protein I79_008274 [Cricetulus griseus]|uniref:Uncharacterized protein n=1 Tax=Cricetulus griseus TaxID=10029 RepID=G3HCR0_CRIGR|nr:hypothetical protein I79_008274 [Cricetulus griseus]
MGGWEDPAKRLRGLWEADWCRANKVWSSWHAWKLHQGGMAVWEAVTNSATVRWASLHTAPQTPLTQSPH